MNKELNELLNLDSFSPLKNNEDELVGARLKRNAEITIYFNPDSKHPWQVLYPGKPMNKTKGPSIRSRSFKRESSMLMFIRNFVEVK